MKLYLPQISETLLIPLWARAEETRKQDALVRDPQSLAMLSQMDYDFGKFSRAKVSQTAVAVRTFLLDREVLAFLAQHPQAVVINLGAGLDTRFLRCRREGVDWYDLDLPEVIAIRRKFFEESEHNHFWAGSVLEQAWMSAILHDSRPVLLIAEGLLMYFSEEEVRQLLRNLAEHFPGAEMLLEVTDYRLVGRGRYHDALKKVSDSLDFRWGWRPDRAALEAWHPQIQFLHAWYLFDFAKERWGWFGYFARLPGVRLTNGILHIRFTPAFSHRNPFSAKED